MKINKKNKNVFKVAGLDVPAARNLLGRKINFFLKENFDVYIDIKTGVIGVWTSHAEDVYNPYDDSTFHGGSNVWIDKNGEWEHFYLFPKSEHMTNLNIKEYPGLSYDYCDEDDEYVEVRPHQEIVGSISLSEVLLLIDAGIISVPEEHTDKDIIQRFEQRLRNKAIVQMALDNGITLYPENWRKCKTHRKHLVDVFYVGTYKNSSSSSIDIGELEEFLEEEYIEEVE